MTAAEMHNEPRRLYKSRRDQMIDGVCAGLAEYLGIDASIMRIVFVLLVFFGGTGLFLYIGGMIVMPVNPQHLAQIRTGELPPQSRNAPKTFGIILVAIGVIFLFHNFGWFAFYHIWNVSWGIVLPIVLIVFGMTMIYMNQQARTEAKKTQSGEEQGDDMNMNSQSQEVPYKRLYKSRRDRKLFGVCGGLGDYFSVDPTIIRILLIFLTLLSFGTGIILYLAMAIFVPDETI